MQMPDDFKPMLAKKWTDKIDPTGWWMSEKLDGVRAVWDGEDFVSRTGNVFDAPDRFKAGMPTDVILDGELWMGRGRFAEASGTVRRHGDQWDGVTYMVFDVVDQGRLEERMHTILEHHDLTDYQTNPSPIWYPVQQHQCDSRDALEAYEMRILADGGEGVMLRKPDSLYEVKRSSSLLKVKRVKSDEAVVTGHDGGKGKHEGRLGALVCEFMGKQFKLGTGLTDAQREDPPAIGSVVTFEYFELTVGGVPRFPVFVAVRDYE